MIHIPKEVRRTLKDKVGDYMGDEAWLIPQNFKQQFLEYWNVIIQVIILVNVADKMVLLLFKGLMKS